MGKQTTYHEKFDGFYQGKRWRRLRKQKFARANGLCEWCRKKGVIKAGKEVHHIVPIEENWDLRYSFDNLVLLCAECHNPEHGRESSLQRFNKIWEGIVNGGASPDNGAEQTTKSK